MTVKEVYEIVGKIHEKLDHVIECKEDKKDADKKNSLIYKIMFSLFGFNILGLAMLVLTLWLTSL